MQEFDKPISIGVVFDVNITHDSQGNRIIDVVKNSLVSLLQGLGMSARFYTSHPKNQAMPRNEGESTYHIVTYQEPMNFSIENAFKDAVSVIGAEKFDEKYVFIFTNRFCAPSHYRYKKGLLLNTIKSLGCKIYFFGIGQSYDQITLRTLAEDYDSKLVHVDEPSGLVDEFCHIFG
jgi:hypothetical protein